MISEDQADSVIAGYEEMGISVTRLCYENGRGRSSAILAGASTRSDVASSSGSGTARPGREKSRLVLSGNHSPT